MTREDGPSRGFIPGLELARAYYAEVVGPLISKYMGGIPHAAALIGPGSEVLGFDSEMSTDHDWAPRVMLFLAEQDRARIPDVEAVLERFLPGSFRGFPVRIALPDAHELGGTERSAHLTRVFTMAQFFEGYLGVLPADMDALDWLAVPQHKLATLVAGAVFRDDVGLAAVRNCLAWYPRDVWRYLMAAVWTRIGQEEHLMGRAGMAGDELGSALIAGRLARDIMRLGFLIERRYSPYAKWFGTAFSRLECASVLGPPLTRVLHVTTWQGREAGLADAYVEIARLQNNLDLAEVQSASIRRFFGRPFSVIGGDRFAAALRAAIEDPRVRRLAERWGAGGIDAISDCTDVMENVGSSRRIRRLFE